MAPVLEFESAMVDTPPAPLLLLLHIFNMAMQFICSVKNDKKSEESDISFDNSTYLRVQEMTMEERRRALRAAAEAGNTSEVQILLRADTYHSASDKEGYTPLHWAAARGHLDVTRLLIESGARLENRGGRKFLFTPLHMASGEGHLEVCRLLLDKGARVKALDRYRDTALHWAAWFGHLPVVKLLVEKGAIVGAKNTDGHTAEDMAALRRQHHVTEWLREQ